MEFSHSGLILNKRFIKVGVFSNRLYQVFIDNLLTELSSDSIRVSMYGIQCHYIMSADDLELISLFVAHMQHNLSIVVRHSRK